jgi:hypothetical protein
MDLSETVHVLAWCVSVKLCYLQIVSGIVVVLQVSFTHLQHDCIPAASTTSRPSADKYIQGTPRPSS